MECVAYMRVSTEKQAEEGNGLDSQKRDIENYARKNGLIITDWYVDDGYTGKNLERPQMQRLIGDCEKHRVESVIAFKLDRISRSMVDALYVIERVFLKYNVDFHCVHDNVSYNDPMQQACTQMVAVFAQLDKNTMMLRMRGGMLERIKQGHWMGGGNTPYCYSYDRNTGTLIPIPERAEQARQAMQLFLDGYPDDKIRLLLGYSSDILVRHILTSVVYIGMIPYKGKVYQGLHEPIFDRETFEKAQIIRKQRQKVHEWKRNTDNILSGICYCGVCGCKMRYQGWGKGKYKIYCYSNLKNKSYIPNWNPNCTNGKFWAQDVEKAVTDKILKISCDLSKTKKPEQQSRYDLLSGNLEKERSKLKRLYALYADGNDTVISMIRDQESTVKQLEAEVQEESKTEQSTTRQSDIVYNKIKTLADAWNKLDNAKRGKVLRVIIKRVVITEGNVDIELNDFLH